jgi:predicted alpha/beta-hydrolase family hydrolase
MSRLRRFPDHRWVGTRDDMAVYDCDDPVQLATLEKRVADHDLLGRLLLSSFAPDTVAEARNRGFHPAR